MIKGMLELQLDEIINDTDNREKIEKLAKRMRALNVTTDYSTYERESELAREKSYLGIQETLHRDAKAMTVLEYETACDMLRERAKEYDSKTKKR